MTLTPTELTLIDRWQRDFPLTERPYEVVGRSVGLTEEDTIATLTSLRSRKVIVRIGAVVRPNTLGASTLAAMAVPPERIDAVAGIVSAEPYVNHNYVREHTFNLWFVIAAPLARDVSKTITSIERHTGLAVINLPIEKAYRIDLGFPLNDERMRAQNARRSTAATPYAPDTPDRAVIAAIEDGLPLVPRPYQSVGHLLCMEEDEVLGRLHRLQTAGVVKRFGCIVRHRTLGYTDNAMAVWRIPDSEIDDIAAEFVRHPRVTLCYRRTQRLPHWPYNLFCMVHAKRRADALAVIDDLNQAAKTERFEQAVLFSTRCYKQRGAVFSKSVGNIHAYA